MCDNRHYQLSHFFLKASRSTNKLTNLHLLLEPGPCSTYHSALHDNCNNKKYTRYKTLNNGQQADIVNPRYTSHTVVVNSRSTLERHTELTFLINNK